MASVEYGWFCGTFGREVEPLWFDPSTDEDSRAAPGETTASILEFHGRARAAADRAITELPLDAVGTSWDDRQVSMR